MGYINKKRPNATSLSAFTPKRYKFFEEEDEDVVSEEDVDDDYYEDTATSSSDSDNDCTKVIMNVSVPKETLVGDAVMSAVPSVQDALKIVVSNIVDDVCSLFKCSELPNIENLKVQMYYYLTQITNLNSILESGRLPQVKWVNRVVYLTVSRHIKQHIQLANALNDALASYNDSISTPWASCSKDDSDSDDGNVKSDSEGLASHEIGKKFNILETTPHIYHSQTLSFNNCVNMILRDPSLQYPLQLITSTGMDAQTNARCQNEAQLSADNITVILTRAIILVDENLTMGRFKCLHKKLFGDDETVFVPTVLPVEVLTNGNLNDIISQNCECIFPYPYKEVTPCGSGDGFGSDHEDQIRTFLQNSFQSSSVTNNLLLYTRALTPMSKTKMGFFFNLKSCENVFKTANSVTFNFESKSSIGLGDVALIPAQDHNGIQASGAMVMTAGKLVSQICPEMSWTTPITHTYENSAIIMSDPMHMRKVAILTVLVVVKAVIKACLLLEGAEKLSMELAGRPSEEQTKQREQLFKDVLSGSNNTRYRELYEAAVPVEYR